MFCGLSNSVKPDTSLSSQFVTKEGEGSGSPRGPRCQRVCHWAAAAALSAESKFSSASGAAVKTQRADTAHMQASSSSVCSTAL